MVVFKNGSIFDGESPDLLEGFSVVVEGEHIREVTDRAVALPNARVIDLAGKTLMPGLIDAHVHVYVHDLNMAKLNEVPRSIAALYAKGFMEASLARGFTSLRDAGGADSTISNALAMGLIKGPRLFYSGRALSQTGGHGDLRSPISPEGCACSHLNSFSVIADGVDAVRAAAREELRCGAHQIKIMASGGTASPSDPIWMLQYSDAEISAAIEEAQRRRTYVMAHAYTPEAITRCLQLGVRSIEHGNLIDLATAQLLVQKDAFIVPTLVTYQTLADLGNELGFPQASIDKVKQVQLAGLTSLEICRTARAKIGFGTDLLGGLHRFQCDEFRIRAEVQSPFEVLRSATAVNADLLNMRGRLGTIAADALADIIVVDGNPLSDLQLFTERGEHIDLIMKDGEIYKNTLVAH